jgi:hypothetical protein
LGEQCHGKRCREQYGESELASGAVGHHSISKEFVEDVVEKAMAPERGNDG